MDEALGWVLAAGAGQCADGALGGVCASECECATYRRTGALILAALAHWRRTVAHWRAVHLSVLATVQTVVLVKASPGREQRRHPPGHDHHGHIEAVD